MTSPIPCPPSIPFLGTITSIDRELPVRGLILLARQFGEIFQIRPLQRQVNFVTTAALADELCDEKRFHKLVSGGLEQVRNGAADGLFTAYHGEPSWGVAHRILIPAFGPAAIRDMFEDMVDLCHQLLLKWERFGPDHAIDPTEDYTRLTFDTIALCAMSYRFNSFYMEDMPPFVTAMSRFLTESGNRATRPAVVQTLMGGASAQYATDIKTMNDVTEAVIAKRRTNPTEKNDLLNMMLNGKDPQTGLGLTPDNIRAQLITFLIAGHETSSGMASFATYYLLKNPETYAKARREVDTVLKGEPIRREHLSKLPYLNAVMRETLRLSPSATAIGVTPDEPTTIGQGKYAIDAGVPCVLLLPVIHRDQTVWGPDANEFNPDRMMPGEFEKIPKNAWKPFGNGMRACIGRGFALQEILIALASILQKFDLRLADPTYTLELHQNLTIKPKGLSIHASPRVDGPKLSAGPGVATNAPVGQKQTSSLIPTTNGKPLYAVYGGNTGSCEGFAQKLAGTAAAHGFSGQVIVLDSLAGSIPKDGPVIIFTASFEGEPADNAAHFVQYIKGLNPDELSGVKFAVFGCGNREWASTYQAIPRLVNSLLTKAGAQQLLPREEADAGGDSFFETFDSWEDKLWPTLTEAFEVERGATEAKEEEFVVHVTDTVRAAKLRQGDTGLGKVIENRLLSKDGAPIKRHIEFELPQGTSYRAGDYLAILPVNPPESVRRCLAHFGLLPEQQIVIKSSGPTTLPVNDPVSLSELLSGYVELAQPATKRNIQTMLAATSDAGTKTSLENLIANYKTEVFEKRLSILDILELHSQVKLSLGSFIQLLPGMRVRQYSISSSPLWNPEHATLTISVVEAPALSGRPEKFLGVASNYLANLKAGDRVSLSVRPGAEAFHLPNEPDVPIVMFCAGAGIAPMRGFIQERALQLEAGRKVGKALLFVGCRKEDEDYLYSAAELKEWADKGAVELRPAFSREEAKSLGCKYVQHRVLHDQQDIIAAYDAGAKFYTCGSLGVSNGVKDACLQIIKGKQPDKGDEWAEEVWKKIQRERYSTDVFG